MNKQSFGGAAYAAVIETNRIDRAIRANTRGAADDATWTAVDLATWKDIDAISIDPLDEMETAICDVLDEAVQQ